MGGRIPLFGIGITAKSPTVTAKRLQNLYAEQRPQGEKSMMVAYGTPGQVLFIDFGATPPRGGLEFEKNNVCYVVHRGNLWEVNNAGVKTLRGTLLTSTGRVSMSHNGVQIMVVDGTAGYIYSTVAAIGTAQTISSIVDNYPSMTVTTAAPHGLVTGNLITLAGVTPTAYNGSYTVTVTGASTFTFQMDVDPGGNASGVGTYTNPTFVQITAPGFPANPLTCTYLLGTFIVNFFGSARFFVSATFDGLFWGALNFSSVGTNPGTIVSVWASNGQLILLCGTFTEYWGPSGQLTFPFVLLQGTATEWGLAATWSIAKYGNTLAYLIKNRMGQVMVSQLNGYLPQELSNVDFDSIVNGYTNTADASAYSYMLGGHQMYAINFPSAGTSWLYDGSTGIFSPLKSAGQTGHNALFSFQFQGNTIVADSSTGRLYKLTAAALDDNGSMIERELVSETVADPLGNFIELDCLRVDMEVGVGLAGQAFAGGANYLTLDGNGGSYVSTPTNASNQITGNIDLRALIAPTSWSSGINQAVISKFNIGAISYELLIGFGFIAFNCSSDGSTLGNASTNPATTGFSANFQSWIRATAQFSGGNATVNFYTSSDGINWTQLGTTKTITGTGSLFAGTAEVEIGSIDAGVISNFTGKIYRAQIYNGISGTLAVDFNPDNAATGATSFTSSTTGEVYTLHGGTTIAGNYAVATPGANPQIGLSISRDNGRTWGAQMLKTLGAMGQYGTRVEWRRLGTVRNAVFKLSVSDPVPVNFVSACLNPDT